MNTLFIFFRDLRLYDNTTLDHIKNKNLVYGVYDDPIIKQNKFVKQLFENILEDLPITITRFQTLQDIKRFVIENDITTIAYNECYTMNKLLKPLEIKQVSLEDYTLLQKKQCLNKSGKSFKVYTKFLNNCKRKLWKPSGHIEHKKGIYPIRKKALSILQQIHDGEFDDYSKTRNYPDGTTKIGKYLSYGVISIREVYNAIKATNIELIKELLWRDFYYFCNDYLMNRIHSYSNSSNTIPDIEYPYIKKAIQDFKKNGWMENRMRMIVAMYLIRTKKINALYVRNWMSRYMIDYYDSSLNGGIFWTINQPEFRIFNYQSQEKKYFSI